MDVFLLYLFTRVDDLRGIATCFSLVGFIGGLSYVLFRAVLMVAGDEFKPGERASMEAGLRAFKWPLIAVIVGVIAVKMIVPSQKDLAIIVGGKLAVEAATSDTAKKVLDLVNGKLDEEIAAIAKAKAK